MTSMSGMFNGELHWLEPGVYFPEDGARDVVDGWEILEEEDVLSPFESHSQEPLLRTTGVVSEKQDQMFPLRHTEQAWGALSITMTALAMVLDIEKKQYQHNWPGQGSTKGETKWSFQTTEALTERL